MQRMDLIRKAKIANRPSVLCEGLDESFYNFFMATKSLGYDARPDYAKLKGEFKAGLKRLGFKDDGIYCWTNSKIENVAHLATANEIPPSMKFVGDKKNSFQVEQKKSPEKTKQEDQKQSKDHPQNNPDQPIDLAGVFGGGKNQGSKSQQKGPSGPLIPTDKIFKAILQKTSNMEVEALAAQGRHGPRLVQYNNR